MNTDIKIDSSGRGAQHSTAAAWWQLLSSDTEDAVLWRPHYVSKSAWLEHIPFAFWLIGAMKPATLVELGTHRGASYFAFCQAVERLGINTRCYAIDSWKGDMHAGYYDESVFRQVSEYNAAQFSAFSRLVRSDFNDALAHFSDNSIDLLHIDGLHTYEAVKEDFENWLPKLSERGVVIFHDTNVRERQFGVFRLFEQIKHDYPHFEFVHGHGLGVLGVGKSQTSLMQTLYAMQHDNQQQREVQGFFARLGRACADMLAASELRELRERHKQEVKKSKAAQKDNANLKARCQQISQQASESSRLAKMYRKADAQRARAQADVKAIKASTSWRVTLPLRVLGRLYKRLKQ